ncbi:hypothetical protein, partial [Staphylococcus hyicus]|uniref:hypothetical protein n=1 Tax=Staphylococcus hyicus TaxID=1284 RepID=UPI001430B976
IALKTGVSQSVVSRIRSGERQLGNISLDSAEKLFEYQKGLEKIEEIKSKIVEVENPNNIANYEAVQRFYIDIISFGDTYDVEYADIAEVEHDNGNTYFIVELNTVREVKFADTITDSVDLGGFRARFEREDEKGETITETLFFHSLEYAEEYVNIVLKAEESFEDCAKKIGIIE